MKRVLVVEDEASIREMVALNLKMAGWEVVEAPSAERALELMHSGERCGYLNMQRIFMRHWMSRFRIWCCWILCCRAWTA